MLLAACKRCTSQHFKRSHAITSGTLREISTPWPSPGVTEDQDRFKFAPGKRREELGMVPAELVESHRLPCLYLHKRLSPPHRPGLCCQTETPRFQTRTTDAQRGSELMTVVPSGQMWSKTCLHFFLLWSFSRGGVFQPCWLRMIHVPKQMLHVLIFGWSRGAEGFGSPFKWIHIPSPLTFPCGGSRGPQALASVCWRVTDVTDGRWMRMWVRTALKRWWQGCSGMIGCCRADGSTGGLGLIHADSHGDEDEMILMCKYGACFWFLLLLY